MVEIGQKEEEEWRRGRGMTSGRRGEEEEEEGKREGERRGRGVRTAL